MPEVTPVKWARFALDQLFSDQWDRVRKEFYHQVKEQIAHTSVTEQSFLTELLISQLSLLGFASIHTDPNLGEAVLVLRLQHLEKLPSTLEGDVQEILVYYSQRIAEYGAKGISGYSAIAHVCAERLGLNGFSEFVKGLEAEFTTLGETWRADAGQYRYRSVEPNEIIPNATRTGGARMNLPTTAASGGPDSYTEESMMVAALWTETKVGPNDELPNQYDRKAYWISTIRYPEAGWQTAVFNRNRLLWLMRPIFRINEMEDPFRALLNHCTAIIVVAEAKPQSWPRGMKWAEPAETSWLKARAKIINESPKQNDPAGIIRFYSTLRSRYQCTHSRG
jgi:hypothetical protein